MRKRLIPCLDMRDGRVVKGKKFQNIEDVADPITLAKQYEADGADELFILDITGTNRPQFLSILKEITQAISIPVTCGGAIRSVKDVRDVLDSGAEKASITSAALDNPDLIKQVSDAFGRERIVLSIDAKQVDQMTWHAFTQGGKQDTKRDVIEWAKTGQALGAGEILLNSIDRDGIKDGYALDLNKAVSDALSIPVIASGGAGSLEDFKNVFIETNVSAALAASVFHYGEINLTDLKEYLREFEIDVEEF